MASRGSAAEHARRGRPPCEATAIEASDDTCYGRSSSYGALPCRQRAADLAAVANLTIIALGALTLFWPGTTATVLLAFIAAWAIVTGVLEIAAAIGLRKVIQGEWMIILAGAASVLFGVLMVLQPAAGAVAIIWLIGAYALIFGVLLSILALQLRSLGHTIDRAVPGAV